jgi:hypothetical protein
MNTSGPSDEQLNKILDKSKTDILLGKASFFDFVFLRSCLVRP